MFGSIGVGAEPEVLKLWHSESELAVKRQAALDKAAAIAAAAGAAAIDGAGERVTKRAMVGVARARAESEILAESIIATRRRRQAALEKELAGKIGAVRAEVGGKERELADLAAKQDALVKQISQLQGVPMATLPTDGYQTPRSACLETDIMRLEAQIAGLERMGVKVSGVIEGDSVADLEKRVADQAPSAFVPSVHDIHQWLAEIEVKVKQDRPDLLRGRMEVPREIIAEIPHGKSIVGGIRGPGGIARELGPARLVPFRKKYVIAFRDGEIEREKSSLIFLDTAQDERGPQTYRTAASESAKA